MCVYTYVPVYITSAWPISGEASCRDIYYVLCICVYVHAHMRRRMYIDLYVLHFRSELTTSLLTYYLRLISREGLLAALLVRKAVLARGKCSPPSSGTCWVARLTNISSWRLAVVSSQYSTDGTELRRFFDHPGE